MDPWYKCFKGTIVQTAARESGVTGTVEQVNETTLRILELPVRKWTQDYKEFLEGSLSGTDKIKEPFIKDYKEHNTDTRVHFEVILSEEKMTEALSEGLLKKFKLTTTISTGNMHLFDENGLIRKFDTPEQSTYFVSHLYCFVRPLTVFQFLKPFNVKRKKVQLEELQYELLKLDMGVVKGEIIVSNRKRADLLLELKNKGFTPFPKKAKASELPVIGGDALMMLKVMTKRRSKEALRLGIMNICSPWRSAPYHWRKSNSCATSVTNSKAMLKS